MNKRFYLLCLLFFVLVAGRPAAGASLAPEGASFEIPFGAPGAVAASNARGETVLAWSDGTSLFYEVRDAAGEHLAVLTSFESSDGDSYVDPAVGIDAAGGFVLVWLAVSNFPGLPPAPTVLFQRFDSQARPRGDAAIAFSNFVFSDPAVAMHPDGSFVVLGVGQEGPNFRGVYLQRFDARGGPFGEVERLNEPVLARRYLAPSAAYDGLGELLTVWSSFTCGADSCLDFRVDGQRFDARLEREGSLLEGIGLGTAPAVAGQPAGGHLVAWTRPVPNDTLFHEGDFRILGRRVAQGGFGTEIEIKPEASGLLDFFGSAPALAVDALGYGTVFWEDAVGPGEDGDIFGQLLNPDLGLEGERFRLPHEEGTSNDRPALAAAGSGNVFAFWAHGNDLVAQRFRLQDDLCLPELTRLCLENRRFELTGSYRTRAGEEGPVRFVSLSDDSAYGWFFRPDNAEMLVKFQDGRIVNDFFWFFFAGLTNVELEMTLRDLLTGEETTYTKPQGALTSFADTRALPSTGGGGATGEVAPREIGSLSHGLTEVTGGLEEGSCLPGPQTLCLANGRFSVELERGQASGPFTRAFSSPLTDSAGAFWFARPTNLEVVVKIIDGSLVNGKFWVFYGSATNQPFELTITDTETGVVKSFARPAGPPTSFADTSAFDSP